MEKQSIQNNIMDAFNLNEIIDEATLFRINKSLDGTRFFKELNSVETMKDFKIQCDNLKHHVKDVDLLALTIVNIIFDKQEQLFDSVTLMLNADMRELDKYIEYCDLIMNLSFKQIELMADRLKELIPDRYHRLNSRLLGLHFISNIEPKFCNIRKKLVYRKFNKHCK